MVQIYRDKRPYKLWNSVIFLTQNIAVPFMELEIFQSLQCITLSYELLRFNIVFITDRHLTNFYDSSEHKIPRFSLYNNPLVNFSHFYLHLCIYNVSVKHNKIIVFIIVLGQHVSILIESSSGPSKIQILT